MDIRNLKGIGDKKATLMHKLGIYTTKDLINYFPRTYEKYDEPKCVSELETDTLVSVKGKVVKRPLIKRTKSMTIVTAILVDENGDTANMIWFNSPFITKTINIGENYIFRGIIRNDGHGKKIEHPEVITLSNYRVLQSSLKPVYSLTKGISNKVLSDCIKSALAHETIVEYLPKSLIKENKLIDLNLAYKNIHFPANKEEAISAKNRLVFDEFFLFISAIRWMKRENVEIRSSFKMEHKKKIEDIISSLSFKLTNSQARALKDVLNDMESGFVANRLIQGDVGCGKTIVAELALTEVVLNGYQGAIMVPTEVLAAQHYEDITSLYEKCGLDINVCLLTGSKTAAEKRKIYEKLKNHEIDIVVGTHALFQEKVIYDNLALVITDEQHRFGVKQREALGNKGNMPHTIVMSATPIPRTLAIILYGDLNVSVIDEMPSNRIPIKNCVVDTSYRPNAYRFINNQIKEGRQAYVICPMVEESEEMDIENVTDYVDKLKKIYPPSVIIEGLNGRMKPKEKNEIMERFARGDINILISTTVVEVGVNVPNATVMMIENAERFGLAGLHQLRGRVGRGKYQSYCIFINTSNSKESKKRLEILNNSNDGFYIANEDLKLRGSGDLFGVRQSGDMYFKIGDIIEDSDILMKASSSVDSLDENEDLSEEELINLNIKKEEYYNEIIKSINL